MGFQRARADKAPDCPWCGGTMIPCPELKGRLCCPNDEAVDYRSRGERWYFNGQIHPLGEPFPPGPDRDEELDLGKEPEPEPDDAPDRTSEPSPDQSSGPSEDHSGLGLDVIAEIESLLGEDRDDGGGSW